MYKNAMATSGKKGEGLKKGIMQQAKVNLQVVTRLHLTTNILVDQGTDYRGPYLGLPFAEYC